MQKVEGVQSVQVSLKDGLTILELRRDNKITLAHLRTVIKNNGFVSRDANVLARGAVANGSFEVSGTHERLVLADTPAQTKDGLWKFKTAAPR